LSRRDLLPQPGGIESVVASRKRATADDLPAADREDRVKWPIHLGSAAPSMCSHPSEGENLIVVVDKSLGLDPQLLPVPGHALEIPPDLRVTSVGDRAWCARVFDPFDPWVKERKQPVEVTAAGAGKHRLHDLDVLLRHRSQYLACGGRVSRDIRPIRRRGPSPLRNLIPTRPGAMGDAALARRIRSYCLRVLAGPWAGAEGAAEEMVADR
jgi:hypothetical protein